MIVFAFCVIYMKMILNENTDTFRRSQVPAGLYIFIQQSYHKYKFQKGQKVLTCLQTSGKTSHLSCE